METTLYHYVHCPFCIRVRMALGYLKIPYNSVVVDYADEELPTKLCGKKMLPILKQKGLAMNESLDIIAKLDQSQRLGVNELVSREDFRDLETLLAQIGDVVHPLAMPYWIWTPEFDEKSRRYFQKKKELKRGPFRSLFEKKDLFLAATTPVLEKVESKLVPFFESDKFSLTDILIASHLWGLYVVPEFQFSPKLHSWLQTVKVETQFNYHGDFGGKF